MLVEDLQYNCFTREVRSQWGEIREQEAEGRRQKGKDRFCVDSLSAVGISHRKLLKSSEARWSSHPKFLLGGTKINFG